jgi:putative membrane protein
MTTSAALAFLHHLAAFMLFAVIMVQMVLLKGEITVDSARSLLRVDAINGVSAIVLLTVGFMRVFYTEKGAGYYFHSGTFIAKMVLFAAAGLLSIYPTLQILGWRRSLREGRAPALDPQQRRKLRTMIHLELLALVGAILCAVLMARGIGFMG